MHGISERTQRRVPRIRDARDTRKDAMTKPRFKEVVPNAKHPPNPDYRPSADQHQEHARTHIVAGCASALPTLADIWRQLETPQRPRHLAAQITRLSADLERTRLDRANLRAAMRATLAAYADGEPDPLWYLRDELNAPQTPAGASRRPA